MKERINGIKMLLESLTDEEVLSVLAIQVRRAEFANADVERLYKIAVDRGLIETI